MAFAHSRISGWIVRFALTLRCSAGFLVRGIFLGELRRSFQNPLLHDFASFELHDRSGRDHHCLGWLFGIAADALLGEARCEDAEFTELHAFAIGQGLGDSVECKLDHGEDFLLGEC